MDIETTAQLKLFVGLLSLALAILSLSLGATSNFSSNSGIFRISGWYVGAVIFAVLGILLLRLPGSKRV